MRAARLLKTSLLCSGLATSLFAAACRGDENNNGNPDAPVNTGGMTIYDIQNPDNRVAIDAPVELTGVVVVAIDTYGPRTGNLFLMEPDGGAYSGVLVFGVDPSIVAGLAVGDLVDLSGAVKTEFALTDDTSGRTTTELVPAEGGEIVLTKVGEGTVPDPEVVDALAIAMMSDAAARDAEWEKWEGVLIRANNITQVNNVRDIGDDPMFQEFSTHGSLRIDTSLAPFPAGLTVDTCLASVTGMGDYFFNYKILPRQTSEVVTGGSGCAIEAGALCDDGIDNDYDYGFTGAFVDCDDRGCQLDPSSGCQTDATVVDVQSGAVTGVVNFSNVVITAVDRNNTHLWVADALAGAINNGVYVYRGSGAATLGAEFVVGARIDVSGTVSEFDLSGSTGDTLTEITGPTLTFVSAPAGAPTPLSGVDASLVGSIANGEPYEGVLMSMDNLVVTNNAVGFGQVEFQDTSGDIIIMDDDAFTYTAANFAMGTCHRVVGVMNVQLNADIRTINPRSAADITTANNCN